ncbi:MAG: dihydropteroate synthase [Candidatus Cloacimonadaceae bacterium]|nr:dihydropteroate synthase [Candidatus Cloacimonadaceae bacterium]
MKHSAEKWQCHSPKIMGILNITEDSFSDGGRYLYAESAFKRALTMLSEGADIIDIGGESTRPGSRGIAQELEIERVVPIVQALKKAYPDAIISVDTRKSEVARLAIAAGADIINDISALRHDHHMAEVLAGAKDTKLILMHMQGEPATMQQEPHYEDVVKEITDFFEERISFCKARGISRERLMLDPGIGFGKNLEHNLSILSALDHFQIFNLPIVIGVSRKRFIDMIQASTPDERIGGSLAAAMIAFQKGADIIRVHDVKAHKQFFAVHAMIGATGI